MPLKNLRKGCGIFLAVFVAFAVAYYVMLSTLAERGYLRAGATNKMTLVTLVAAFFMSLTVMITWGIVSTLKDLRRLTDSVWRLKFYEGEKAFLCGKVYPVNYEAVKSPFTQKDCVAYEYEILGYNGKEQTKECWGMRLVPCAVRTMRGEHRVLSRPKLQGFEKRVLKDALAQQRAAEYLASTPFETIALGGNLKQLMDDYMKEYEERDGVVRVDMRHSEYGGANAATEAHETCVEVGQEVCLSGLWLNEKGTVAADLEQGVVLTLYQGGAGEVKSRLIKNAITGVIFALIVGAGINAVILFILTQNLLS